MQGRPLATALQRQTDRHASVHHNRKQQPSNGLSASGWQARRFRPGPCDGPGSLRHAYGAKHGYDNRSEEHTSELVTPSNLVCRLLLEKKKNKKKKAEESHTLKHKQKTHQAKNTQ